ncbi:SLC13 family permease [Roseobacter sp. YSTF-M11]|uniref:SLC13 family permease n=1 Tax=Roseobacter insulae TaxID=2859783 RepID=A0A9X1FSW8_9RHOB|nr:SLC13 family permease [Roseobacter insulae]MBW4706804.1 SLC13 family permease [Roseobacter insulae]
MTPEIALVLTLLVSALILLAKEILPVEQVSLLLVAILAASGVLPADVAFQGFASTTVIMLGCVMVLSRRLAESGLIARLSARIRQNTRPGSRSTLAWLMTVSAGLSSVVTNTSTTAVLIPAVSEMARRSGVRPGRFLMPVAFASMMGGSATLIGTSTNLAASGAVSRLGMEPFGVFEFAMVGLVVSISGIVMMTVLNPWLLPDNPEDTEHLPAAAKQFMATLVVPAGSRSIGMAVGDLGLDARALTALAVSRDGGRVAAHPRRKLREADRVIVRGARAGLLDALGDPLLGLDLDVPAPLDEPAHFILAEAILLPGARWIGQTLRSARAELGSNLCILALHRRGQETAALIERMRLKTGDVLLISGPRDQVEALDRDPDLSLLMPPEPGPPSEREGKHTVVALISAIAAGATGLLPFSVALLIAVLALVLTGRFSLQDMFGMISWRILILIGGMSSFGVAMQTSGTASWLAGNVVSALGGFGPVALLLGLGVLTIILTQPMSNAAAALTVLPVAIGVADQLGADPRPFAVMVTLSASLSFIAPFEPALLLVYGPGHYSIRDFLRAGIPLTLVSLCILLVLVPLLWPLGIAAF